MTEQSEASAHLLVVGANPKSSAMRLRDRLFVEDAVAPTFLKTIELPESMVLSTEMRTDVIAFAEDPEKGAAAIVDAMAAHAGLPADEVRQQVYHLVGEEAVRHVMRVAASLDSILVGDREVLDQFLTAHRLAKQNGRTGARLDGLVSAAAATAERVLSETDLGRNPVSISTSAVEVARDLHGDLRRCVGLLIGGGDTSELIIEEMMAAGLGHVTVTHPTESRATATARSLNVHTKPFSALDEALAAADIVVTALGQTQHTITSPLMKAAIKKRRFKPVFLIDVGIPGDVDPAVEKLEEAFVYTPDDLERVAMDFRSRHKGDAEDAERIVGTAVEAYLAGEDPLEQARRQALAESGGDAERATQLLLNRLKGLLRKP